MDTFAADFAEFWRAFPRRVGKLAAQKAYVKARRSGVTQATLLEGIAHYIKGKPQYADYCHPTTWLNQGRWDDEYGTSTRAAQPQRPFTERELRDARDWYRRVGTSLDRSVSAQEHMANFIRRQRLQAAS